jgi:hypothetical protein
MDHPSPLAVACRLALAVFGFFVAAGLLGRFLDRRYGDPATAPAAAWACAAGGALVITIVAAAVLICSWPA